MSRSDADAWWHALDLPPRPVFSETPAAAETFTLVRRTIAPNARRILNWVATASIEDLLELTPPTTIIEAPSGDTSSDRVLQDQYGWAVDHFSSTFYSEWSTTSLHYAYRWLSGREIPPCNPELMNDRRLDSAKLNAEIARRAVTQGMRRPSEPRVDLVLIGEMTDYAKSLLNEKRYREAAAVFEFGSHRRPYDGQFRNNLGFCLIPEDPEEALGHLKAATEMDYPHPATNTYNQMCCHIALRHIREALALAELMWPRILSTRPAEATLWKHNEAGDWELFQSTDPRASVAELASLLAHEEGWDSEDRAWREHRNELSQDMQVGHPPRGS
jgi:hypothetical protein